MSLEGRGEAAARSRPRAEALTSQPGLRHVVGLVVDPLGAVGPDVGLGGGVSHGVVADPGGQVDVESAGVDDAVCVHQAPFGQLQKWGQRPFRAGLWGREEGSAPAFATKPRMPTFPSVKNPIPRPWGSSTMRCTEDASAGVFMTRTGLQTARESAAAITSDAERLQPGRRRNNLERPIYRRGRGNLARVPVHVCVQLTFAVNTEGNATQ